MATPLFQFDFIKQKPEEIKLEGGATWVDNTCLRLTKTDTNTGTPVTMNWGRAIYTQSVSFSNHTTFQTTIKFTVKPKPNNATPADGLVFFMAPSQDHKFPSNPCDGSFGIFDPQQEGYASNVFAVEFDTFLNPQWDPNYAPHLGIDIQSRISEQKSTTYVPDSSYIGNEVTLTIKYFGGEITATVMTDSYPTGYMTSYKSDLSAIFPGNAVQMGLGASTGNHVAFHDVVYWDFYSPAPN